MSLNECANKHLIDCVNQHILVTEQMNHGPDVATDSKYELCDSKRMSRARRNVAEKAVQVFQDHVVSVMCGSDTKYLMQLWSHILR